MKTLRLIALLVFVGPMLSFASDSCCAPEETHAEAIQADSCGPAVHFEAAGDKCNHEDACSQCAACHLQSFSPNAAQTVTDLLSTRHNTILNQHSFAEVVSTVLTPPPSL